MNINFEFLYIANFSKKNNSLNIAKKFILAIKNNSHRFILVDSVTNSVVENSGNSCAISKVKSNISIKSYNENTAFIVILHNLPYNFPIINFEGRVKRIGVYCEDYNTFPQQYIMNYIYLDEIWTTFPSEKISIVSSGIPEFMVCDLQDKVNIQKANNNYNSLSESSTLPAEEFFNLFIKKRIKFLELSSFYSLKKPSITINCKNLKSKEAFSKKNNSTINISIEDNRLLAQYDETKDIDEWAKEIKNLLKSKVLLTPSKNDISKLKSIKNKYWNNKSFIITNNINYSKIELEGFSELNLKNVFFCNRLSTKEKSLKFKPNFYLFNNCKIILSNYKTIKQLCEKCNALFFFPLIYKKLFKNNKNIFWYWESNIDKNFFNKDYFDISKGVSNFDNSIITTAQISYYLGFRNIYLLGLNFNDAYRCELCRKNFLNSSISIKNSSERNFEHMNLPFLNNFNKVNKNCKSKLNKLKNELKNCRKEIEFFGGQIYDATNCKKLNGLNKVNLLEVFDKNNLNNFIKNSNSNNFPLVVIVARFSSSMGYGIAGQNIYRSLKEFCVDLICIDSITLSCFGSTAIDGFEISQLHDRVLFNFKNLYKNIILLCVETPDKLTKIDVLGNNIFLISYTMFETESLPLHWVKILSKISKIWVPSFFNYLTFSDSGLHKNNLEILPLCLDTNLYNLHKESMILKANTFKFITTISNFNRKDVGAIIRAYYKLFTKHDDVTLIIKLPKQIKEVDFKKFIVNSLVPEFEIFDADNPHILAISANLSNERYNILQSSADVCISIERGKGWDLPAFESMALGIPVIGIAWSANLMFMTEENSYLIPPKRRTIFVDNNLINNSNMYSGHTWSAFDEIDLINMMGKAYFDKDLREHKGNLARKDVHSSFSYQRFYINFMRNAAKIIFSESQSSNRQITIFK